MFSRIRRTWAVLAGRDSVYRHRAYGAYEGSDGKNYIGEDPRPEQDPSLDTLGGCAAHHTRGTGSAARHASAGIDIITSGIHSHRRNTLMHESSRNQDERKRNDVPLAGSESGTVDSNVHGDAALTRTHFQEILAEAEARCFMGKGQERHAAEPTAPFEEHDFWPLFTTAGSGGPQFQIAKKLAEYRRTHDRQELLDVINYAAAMVCYHDAKGLPW